MMICLALPAALGLISSWQVRAADSSTLGPPEPSHARIPSNTASREGKWHTVPVEPRPGIPKIHYYDKLNPVWWFKNVDEPSPPKWYLPHGKARKLKWRFRNSFHNFNNYVIGIADKRFSRSGRYPEATTNPRGGWNFAVSKYKWLRLPFISYRRGKFQTYLGWRDHGNFGIKINVK